jgi:hypothetical protein
VHKQILDKIDDGSLIQELWDTYGDQLESLSHWGTEPTLTLHKFKKFYDEAFKKFPKLKRVFFSSNFMTEPDKIIRFAHEVLPQTADLELGLQISIDGPPWITDSNRVGGSTAKIVQNVKEVVKRLDTPLKVAFNVKPTLGGEHIPEFAKFNIVDEYYTFFENVLGEWFSVMSGKNIYFSKCVDPTIALPTPFTKRDGISFYHMYTNQICLKDKLWKNIAPPECHYYTRWVSRFPFYREFFTKPRMFTCSAGDTCFGTGDEAGNIHGCHRSYYMNHPEYYNECVKYGLAEQTMEGMEAGRNEILKKLTIANLNDEAGLIKFLYVNRAFHDFAKHRLSTSMALVKEMAKAGQINKVYNDWRWAELLSMFILTVICQMDNVLTSSCFEINPSCYFKLFGNGTFEKIIERTKLAYEKPV